ncbi:MAG: hypothetical protein JSW67_10370 [Candidatus Latescibacterota bacterium]|nr:MAG: hypothetical protein JSW67_10370 [Candidatus Latescibacterota bacterium]
MHANERLEEEHEESRLTRWIPSAILDLPPLEPVFALRTPHRVSLQAMPSSRDALRNMLHRSFEIHVEVDTENSPLRHVPVHDVHEARLTPDLPLEWQHYYWIADGLQDDLASAPGEPASALERGRRRLAACEATMRTLRQGSRCQLWLLQEAWSEREGLATEIDTSSRALFTAQQYVRGLSGHLIDRTGSRAFADWMAELLGEAERRAHVSLPTLSHVEKDLLGMYLQHRLFGNAPLTSPAGMIAGWHLLLSAAILGVWFAGLLVDAGYESEIDEALIAALWMLDQGFWCDEALVHDVLRNLNASEYTSAALASALTSAMHVAHSRT